MKKEEFVTPAEMQALLAGNEEISEELKHDERLGERDLISLQKAVMLLSKQVEDLQLQLHEQNELQSRQQEQFLRLCRHELENKLYEQLVNTIVGHQQVENHEDKVELQHVSNASEQASFREVKAVEKTGEDSQPSFSRVKSYSKIRKRKKGFIEKLFE